MSLKYFKNPIILGLLGAILSYVYLYWKAEQKYKEDKSVKKEQVNILIPGAIGVIVWFIAATYFESENEGYANNNHDPKIDNKSLNNTSLQNMTGGSKMNSVNHTSKSSSVSQPSKMVQNKSYHLIGKNRVRLPPTDVFIDIARF